MKKKENFKIYNKNKIPTQNTRNGKIFYKSLKNIDNNIIKYQNYKITYKGFILNIMKENGMCSYNGYILKYPKKFDSILKNKALEEVKGLYIPHGGFTAHNGFDCCHFDDFMYMNDITKQYKGAISWKTHKYVESELKKVVNSIIILL
jgi:hypothetical protein